MNARPRGPVRQPLRLADVLGQALRTRGFSDRLARERAVARWPAVVGAELAVHTTALAVRNGVLAVAVRDGIWATQLTFLRTELLGRLRRDGVHGVRDIAFRIGMPLHGPGPERGRTTGPTTATSLEVAAGQELAAGIADPELQLRLARLYAAAAARRRRMGLGGGG